VADAVRNSHPQTTPSVGTHEADHPGHAVSDHNGSVQMLEEYHDATTKGFGFEPRGLKRGSANLMVPEMGPSCDNLIEGRSVMGVLFEGWF
jgi:hypothetical protein